MEEKEKLVQEYSNKVAILGDRIYHAWRLLLEIKDIQQKHKELEEKDGTAQKPAETA